MVAEIMAFVDQDHTVSPKLGQFSRYSRDREYFCKEAVFGNIILPHLDQILRADNECFREVIILKYLGERGRH